MEYEVSRAEIIGLAILVLSSFLTVPNAYIHPMYWLIMWTFTGQILWWIYDGNRIPRTTRKDLIATSNEKIAEKDDRIATLIQLNMQLFTTMIKLKQSQEE